MTLNRRWCNKLSGREQKASHVPQRPDMNLEATRHNNCYDQISLQKSMASNMRIPGSHE
jgi:hypothetical protein